MRNFGAVYRDGRVTTICLEIRWTGSRFAPLGSLLENVHRIPCDKLGVASHRILAQGIYSEVRDRSF